MSGPKLRHNHHAGHSGTTTAVPSLSNSNSMDNSEAPVERKDNRDVLPSENGNVGVDDGTLQSDLKKVTLRTFIMAVVAAMGGFVFGYDTGQISGFLEMQNFLIRFAQSSPPSSTSPSGYHFTNVRSGLIVGLVCRVLSKFLVYMLTYSALNRYFDRMLGRGTSRPALRTETMYTRMVCDFLRWSCDTSGCWYR